MLSHLAARERGSRHSLVGVRSLALRLGPDLELHGHTGCVNTLRWSRGGRLLVSGGDDVTVKVWRYPDGALLSTLPTGHTGNIFCAAMLQSSLLLLFRKSFLARTKNRLFEFPWDCTFLAS